MPEAMLSPSAPRPAPVLPRRIAVELATAAWQTYRRGGRMLVAAPLLVGIAILPEFVQHIVEIRLGMFADAASFRAHGNDALRWGFGYAKLTGFLLAILFSARFWAVGSVRRTLKVPPRTLAHVLAAILLVVAVSWPFSWLGAQGLPRAVNLPLQILSGVLQAGAILYLVGVLLEEPMPLRQAFGRRLPSALVLALLVILAFVPSQALHTANHRIALGKPAAILWPLMTFDSLLVGLLAGLAGSALFVGYRTGLTWRGWTRRPSTLDVADRRGGAGA